MTKFYILDERDIWAEPLAAAARKRGFEPVRVRRGHTDYVAGSWGFIRPHATPEVLRQNWRDYYNMRAAGVEVVQDTDQIELYEYKSGQTQRWNKWMPTTRLFDDYHDAMEYAHSDAPSFPIVSKANEGASSVNVRILPDRDALLTHLAELWGCGVRVRHCDSKGTTSVQHGYAILQEFIPHDVTYRVNIIGNGRAVFKRYNYPDRPVAQTGNVEPMMTEWSELLEFADRVAADIGTRWCALDILERPSGGFVLLETSLAWPWPSPGDCMSAPIFRTAHTWANLFEAMFDEIVNV